MLNRGTTPQADSTAFQIDRWRDRLIDLSRRNPLIALRLARRAHLRLSRPEPGRVFDRLARERAEFRFWLPPDAEATTPEVADSPKRRYRPRPDELLCEDLDRRELSHVLTHLYRRARSDFQERGLRVLHVAFGLLEWKEVANGPAITSPVVLLPVVLERPRPGEPFVLRPAEDEAFVNPALLLRVSRDFHLRLPPLPDTDDETFRLGEYLDTVGAIVANLPDAKLEKSTVLSLLSFDKGVIHQDLSVHAEAVGRHPFVRALAGEPLPPQEAPPAGENEYLILDADASQEEAVRAARRGSSFVLIGPPGTGKSQTIANIIADQIAHGRSVLFVSEKIAALEVVYRRLQHAGLGDDCLEVHSHLAQRGRVVQELHRCLHLDDKPPPVDDETDRLRSLRGELDAVVAALHHPRTPLHLTAYDAAQAVATHSTLPSVRLNIADPLTRTREWLDEACHAVGRLTRLGHLLREGDRFPWHHLRTPSFSLHLRDEITQLVRRVLSARTERDAVRRRTSEGLGFEDAPMEWLVRLAELLGRSPRPPREWFREADLDALTGRVRRCREMRDGLREHRRTLASRYGPAVWQLAEGTAKRLAESWENLRPHLPADAGRKILTVVPALREWARLSREVIPGWIADANRVVPRLGDLTIRRVEQVAELIETLNTPPVPNGPRTFNEKYGPELFGLDLERLAARFGGPYLTAWGRAGGQYRRDRAAISRVSRSGTVPRTIADDLVIARDLLRSERVEWEEHEVKVRRLAGWLGLAELPRRPLPPETTAAARRLRDDLTRWSMATAAVGTVLADWADRPFAELLAYLDQLAQVAAEFEVVLASSAGHLLPRNADVGHLLDDLRQAELLRAWLQAEDGDPDRRRAEYGPDWQGLEATDWDAILDAIEWVREVRQHFLPQTIPESFVGRASEASNGSSEELLRAERLHRDASDAIASLFEPGHVIDPELILSRLDELPDWFDWRDLPAWLHRLGLEPLWQFVRSTDLPPESWRGVFEKAFFTEWLDALCLEDARLRDFRGEEFEQLVARFRDLDSAQLRVNALRVGHRVRHGSEEPLPAAEVETLHRQALIRMRHRPLRQLFAEIPTLLRRLKPCLLMSPMSVSQFLGRAEADFRFDLVIFDEASQIPPEDAIGAIYRGRQTVIVGDDKQLPPTSFFQADGNFGREAVGEVEPYPSILDQCRTVLPSFLLRWHYRSRDESLIAFSNRHFYGDRLMTFPSANRDPERGVRFHHVPDGVYDRGGRRQNRREAEEVAELVFAQLRARPDKTVGVIAFSQAQMMAIEDQIERQRRQHPEFEDYFRDDRLEGVFVRNLETVQGDERDVIFLSVGYGRDQRGKPSLNFGPLNRSGGERRLNVAVTRAREKLVLVSSLTAGELAGRSGAEGIRLLRKYLEYAQGGLNAWAVPPSDAEASAVWADVREVLSKWGFHSEAGVGCSGGRVEVGVLDPDQAGRFLLGVVGDGAAYRMAGSASERDRLRPATLKSLGWRLHTIWTLDWVRRRGPELERLRAALESAQKQSRQGLRPRRRGNTLPTGG